MRKVGSLPDRASGETLGAYLYAKGIANDIDIASDGSWSVWIHADEHLDEGSRLLEEFIGNPDDPKYATGAELAKDKLDVEKKLDERFKKQYHDRSKVFTRARLGFVTAFLLVSSIAVTLMSSFGQDESMARSLRIRSVDMWLTGPDGAKIERVVSLPEVRDGEVWRLIMPIFLHMDVIHLLFNMMWLYDLGRMLEHRHGSIALLIFVLAAGIVSNYLQFRATGPYFGGMSGVVYAMLGYIWMRAKVDPLYSIHLRKSTVMLMGIWFVLCFFSKDIANTAHAAGLAIGVLAGVASGKLSHRQRQVQ